jgi:hypothetical protein
MAGEVTTVPQRARMRAGEVFGSDVRPTGRGIEAGNEGKRAYLLIPVRTGLEAGDDLEWTFSW